MVIRRSDSFACRPLMYLPFMHRARWATPVWLLASTVLSTMLSTVLGCSEPDKTLTQEQLMDPEECRSCHAGHNEQWEGSMHAYAGVDPVFLAMNARAQEETNGEIGDFCVQCHAPMAVRTGATTDGLNLNEVPDYLKGVTCYFCHSVADVKGSHNNPIELADDLVMRGAIVDAVENDAHLSAYDPRTDRKNDGSAQLCGTCHDIVTPQGAHIERTYLEWQDSLFSDLNKGGLTCGHCHMPGREGFAASTTGGVTRRVHDHSMPGVDVALTPFPYRDEQLASVTDELRATAIGQLCVAPPLDTTSVTVTLENAFAGHSFPSGATADRRLWVEVLAFDTDENVIFESGRVDPDTPIATSIDPNLWLFHDRIFEADDSETLMIWEAHRFDSYLLRQAAMAGEAHFDERVFSIPIAAGAPERIDVRLRMRPMGLEILDSLVDSGHLAPEVRAQTKTFDVLDISWSRSENGFGCIPKDVF